MLNQQWVLIADNTNIQFAFFLSFLSALGPIYFFEKEMDAAQTQILNLVMHALGNWAVREKGSEQYFLYCLQ
jgi:hypothetical protein